MPERVARIGAATWVVLLLMVTYLVLFSALSIRQHDAFLTHKEDLGQIDQAVWNSLHGRLLVETDDQHQSTRLTDHAEPSLVLSSLVFLLWDDVRALLIWQALVAALGAWAVFVLARDVLGRTPGPARSVVMERGEQAASKEEDERPINKSSGEHSASHREVRPVDRARVERSAALGVGHPVRTTSEWLAVLFAFVYLLFPALEAAHLAEFHAAPLASAPIAFAFLFLERRQWGRFVLAGLLVAAVKEEMALAAVMLGLAGVVVGRPSPPPPTSENFGKAPNFGRAPKRGRGRRSVDEARSRPTPLPIPQLRQSTEAGGDRFAEAESGEKHTRVFGLPASIVWPALLVIVAAVWFGLSTFVIIPYFGAAKYGSGDSIYFQRFGVLGATPAAVVRTLLTNPALVWSVLSQPARLGYVGGLLASVGFMALAAPWALLVGAPLLLLNLLSDFAPQYSGDFHYSAPLVPFFVVAAVYGMRRLLAWLRWRRMRGLLALWLLAWALVVQYARGYAPSSENFYWPDITPHNQNFARMAAGVLPSARLSTTPPLFPHLSHREVMYVFPQVGDADSLLLDAAGVTDMHPNDFRAAVLDLLAGGQYGVREGIDGYLLLQRGAPARELPDSFFDFARAPNAQPQVRVDVTFGEAVRLLGYDLLPDTRWHMLRVRYYWQALRPLEDDLRVYPFYHDAQGNIIEDTSKRPMVETLWYPPSRWRVGETVQTETLAWDVGDAFRLAAGVLHGSDWDRKGRRLATASGDTQVELGAYAWQGKTVVRQ